ncbi:MAG: hypothetical protein N3H31_01605 [Candidatus Nezhaarchaeota archaeon]|nr:hypothetical protein [Candidatus Nezhaarchaeota archaeon]
MRPGSKVYYLRALLGCLAGALSGLLSFSLRGLAPSQLISLASVALAFAAYYFSIFLAKAVGVKAEDLNNPSYLKRGGLFTFIFLWLTSWSLTASLLIHPSSW